MNIMAKKAKKEELVGYLDPELNHKKKADDIKFMLIQTKRLGLMGKHAGSKPVSRLRSLLRTANERIKFLTKLAETVKEENAVETTA